MEKHRDIGNDHVLDIDKTIREQIRGEKVTTTEETTLETVNFILKKYDNIVGIHSKFEFESPDQHPDLTIILHDKRKVNINLFKIKGNAKIQPKNLGAKSFLEKYFLSSELQRQFNNFFEIKYMDYLRQLVIPTKNVSYSNKTELKHLVRNLHQRFSDHINPIRQSFLYTLREFSYELLQGEYNQGGVGINHAFEKLLLLDSINIITRYHDGNKCSLVEELKFQNINGYSKVSIYKKGQNTLGIRSGTVSLLIRFKFESGPTSSVKLATSFEEFPDTKDKIEGLNKIEIRNFEKLLVKHKQTLDQNKSNAVGKCNEALIYYTLLKKNLTVYQVDPFEYKDMFIRYSTIVSGKTIKDLLRTAEIAVRKLNNYLEGKYSRFQYESIQLVPDSYLDNRLDTSDLKVIVRVDEKVFEEKFSLKAYAKKVKKLTTKNPGVGTILGEHYFNIGSMQEKIAEVKEEFHSHKTDHQQCLVKVSNEIGKQLSFANQNQLRKGIQALLGQSALVISFYSQYESVVLEHGNVSSEITVEQNYPSMIQNTLFWNEKQEELSLRVKFSAGQDKGWSSLKLSCEVSVSDR